MLENEELSEVQNESEVTAEFIQETEAQQDNEQTQTEEESQEQKAQIPNQANDPYVDQVQNWRALREKVAQAERERDEALARLNQNQPNTQTNQESFNIGDDDLAEGKHLKYYYQQSEQKLKQVEEQLIETKLRNAYPDFDSVVNQETLSMLRDADPELTESLAANPNLYSKAVAAYKSIKRYGLSPKSYDKEKEMVKNNSAKPRTVNSLSPQQGNSPLSKANEFAQRLTPERKKQIREEMREIIRNG